MFKGAPDMRPWNDRKSEHGIESGGGEVVTGLTLEFPLEEAILRLSG